MRRPQELFRADTSGIHAAHDVVTVERFHVRAEISRTDSILPRERKARHLPPQQQLATILTTNILGSSASAGQSPNAPDLWVGIHWHISVLAAPGGRKMGGRRVMWDRI